MTVLALLTLILENFRHVLRKMEMIELTLVEFEKDFSLHDSIIEKIFYDIENDDDGILNICTFEFVRYEPSEDIYPIMKIKAENVEVVELERYDL